MPTQAWVEQILPTHNEAVESKQHPFSIMKLHDALLNIQNLLNQVDIKWHFLNPFPIVHN